MNGNVEFYGELRRNRKWNGKGYDINGNLIYELDNGNGKVMEYEYTEYEHYLIFRGEYLNGRRYGNGR